MKAYYGSKISENMTATPEGFLICLAVPIARTGAQEYMPYEIGVEGEAPVAVHRLAADVFSAPTLASFEGKPITCGHPPVAVEPGNASAYVKGHAQNIRRGAGNEADLVLSDLFITDPELIRLIRHAGVREISCGYECEYDQDLEGQIYQRCIRGNHIAVVLSGRAGTRVAIKDAQPEKKQGGRPKMNRKPRNTLFSRMFAGWAKDAEPDEVAAAFEELVEQARGEDADATEACESPQVAEKQETDSPQLLAQLLEAVRALNNRLEAMQQAEASDTDPISALERELQKMPEAQTGIEDEETAVILPMDDPGVEEDGEPAVIFAEHSEDRMQAADRKALLAAVQAIKPIIAELPPRERRRASDMAAQKIRQAAGKSALARTNGYRAIDQLRSGAAAQHSVASDGAELGQSIMAKYNPHYKVK